MCILSFKTVVLIVMAYGLWDLIRDIRKMLPPRKTVAKFELDYDVHI